MQVYECRPCHIWKPMEKQRRCPICGTPMTVKKPKEGSQ